MRALASHQCVPGSILGPGVTCGLSLLLVLFLAPRGFSPGPPVFPSPQKPTFPNSNSIWNCQALYHEPLARVIAQAFPVFNIKFDLHFDFMKAVVRVRSNIEEECQEWFEDASKLADMMVLQSQCQESLGARNIGTMHKKLSSRFRKDNRAGGEIFSVVPSAVVKHNSLRNLAE